MSDSVSPFADRNYRNLFSAQLTSLAGTGLTTVALALLAVDLAGGDAGQVLGIALALKMVVYVIGAPVISAISTRVPRRPWLITLDLIRAGLVLCLPFVTAVWQIYVLVVLINLCAAAFTPVLQATIPAVLNHEARYQRALSYTQTAYALEQIASPSLAAAMLLIFTYDTLFALNALTFVISALLILAVRIPAVDRDTEPARRRLLFGIKAYLRTPRLRATWALYFAIASASAMVIVNSVVYVVTHLGMSDTALGITLAASGGGSMIGALVTPRLVERYSARNVMLSGCMLMTLGLAIGIAMPPWAVLLVAWFMIGLGLGLAQTPVGVLVRKSCHDRDSASLFAANFSLSHFCWLGTYLLAGYLGSGPGLSVAFGVLTAIAFVATLVGARLFPNPDPVEITHTHPAMTHAHSSAHDEHHAPDRQAPHEHHHEAVTHTHRYVIDEHHARWA